jgi:hypothetical protein
MLCLKKLSSFILGLSLLAGSAFAAEPAARDKPGFAPLFNGNDLAGWMNAGGNQPGKAWLVQDNVLVLEKGPDKKNPGGDIWTRERFGDFVLDLEFKTTGNSGVFIRTDNPRDNVQTGIEFQVDNPGGPSRTSVGSAYDLKAPTKNAARRDDWNRFIISAVGPRLTAELNGEKIIDMNLDDWTTPAMNPDGSKNKFRRALKDFRRDGHIGFQDHGANVMYRNVYIRRVEGQ